MRSKSGYVGIGRSSSSPADDFSRSIGRSSITGLLAYEQTPDALPHSLLQEPAENVAPTPFRESIKNVTDAPLRFARSERHIERLAAIIGMKKPALGRQAQARADPLRDSESCGRGSPFI
jgi:hypothetical protein